MTQILNRKALIKLLLRIGIRPQWIFDHIDKTTPEARERIELRNYFIELIKEMK